MAPKEKEKTSQEKKEEKAFGPKGVQFLQEFPSLKEYLLKHGFKLEKDEIEKGVEDYTPYPEPKKKFRLILTDHEESVEGMYYWMHESYKQDFGFTKFYKVIDTFAATEQSAFFGVSQQRLGLQQDKVSQYLQAIGKMIKELFQFVRELRIIDERLAIYLDSFHPNASKSEGAEVALKGVWIDLVEGGAKNPGSVYGLAREVGFTILPDVFFSTRHVASKTIDKMPGKLTSEDIKLIEELCKEQSDKIADVADKSEFNRKVVEVLKRKLTQYHTWKKMTFKELWTRRRFTLQYFRQHYEVIRLYMNWMKPYLRNVRRLHPEEKWMDSVEMVGAFEGSVVEVEFIATKPASDGYYTIGLVNVFYRTRATMSYQQEGYQRGPKHSGKAIITLRVYGWNQQQIDDYLKMRKTEDIELMETLDSSLKEAIDALRDDMIVYLSEAGEKLFGIEAAEKSKKEEEKKRKEEEEQKKKKGGTVAEPFLDIFSGFGELFGPFAGGLSLNFLSGPTEEEKKKAKAKAAADAAASRGVSPAFNTFKNYRKGHRLLTY